MITRTKKLLLSFFLSIFMLVNFTTPYALAEDRTWYDQDFKPWYLKVYDPENDTEIFGERYTAAQVQWIVYGFVSLLINFVIQDRVISHCIMSVDRGQVFVPGDNGCLDEIVDFIWDRITVNPETNSSFASNEILKETTSPPISSLEYFRFVKSRLNLIPEAEAQSTGYGFTAVSPVLWIWRLVRNVTYGLLVIVMIAMAFMIMFRVKLSPQTVITVQSALPKVIITLILITFSYAIAGFVVDLMYVAIGLLAGIVANGEISYYGWADMFGALTDQNGIIVYLGNYMVFFFVSLTHLVMSDNSPLKQMLGTSSNLFGLLVMAIVMIYLLIIMVKVLWIMVKTYALILVQIIIGPAQILLGTVTGGGFGKWLTKLISLVAVYPTVGFLLLISFIFLRASIPPIGDLLGLPPLPPWFPTIPPQITDPITRIFPFGLNNLFSAAGDTWVPPLTVSIVRAPDSPLLLWLAASLVILSMVPKAAELMEAVFAGGRLPSMGTALGQAVGIVGAPFGAMRREITGRAQGWAGQRAGEAGGWAADQARRRIRLGSSQPRSQQQRQHKTQPGSGKVNP